MSPRVATMSSQLGVGDAAPDVALADSRGDHVPLSELWQSAPLVLLFIRHYG